MNLFPYTKSAGGPNGPATRNSFTLFSTKRYISFMASSYAAADWPFLTHVSIDIAASEVAKTCRFHASVPSHVTCNLIRSSRDRLISSVETLNRQIQIISLNSRAFFFIQKSYSVVCLLHPPLYIPQERLSLSPSGLWREQWRPLPHRSCSAIASCSLLC